MISKTVLARSRKRTAVLSLAWKFVHVYRLLFVFGNAKVRAGLPTVRFARMTEKVSYRIAVHVIKLRSKCYEKIFFFIDRCNCIVIYLQ